MLPGDSVIVVTTNHGLKDISDIPVSYTHLDVYKRQEVDGLRSIGEILRGIA